MRRPARGVWRLEVRPLLSGRDYHSLHHENPAFAFAATVQDGNVAWRPYPDLPAVAALSDGCYRHDPTWFRNLRYEMERERGMDDVEDVASPGIFSWDLAPGAAAVLILRAGDGLSVRTAPYVGQLVEREAARRAAAGSALDRAADAYLIDRGRGRTILAGFPWFTDWGRDTFIAMRGLCIARGRLDEAAAILQAWAAIVDQGMVPNRFADAGAAEYNAVDASLWFIVAGYETLAEAARTGHALPAGFSDRLQDAWRQILEAYVAGTRYRIGMDADGMLRAGVPGVQLTWMDAKVGDWVVTPRIGKPVEVQALWINALAIAAAHDVGGAAGRWRALEQQARASFAARFANPATGGLYDVVDVDHVAGTVDARVRPNQMFALGGLPFALLDGPAASALVRHVEQVLLTPIGLRSLAPDDPDYQPRYEGDVRHRDGAYHQGTVWPWLSGPVRRGVVAGAVRPGRRRR